MAKTNFMIVGGKDHKMKIEIDREELRQGNI